MNTLQTLHRLEHECPVLSSEEQHCPLLGQCIKYRLPVRDQVKLMMLLEVWENHHWSFIARVKIGRLVRKLRRANKKEQGNGSTD